MTAAAPRCAAASAAAATAASAATAATATAKATTTTSSCAWGPASNVPSRAQLRLPSALVRTAPPSCVVTRDAEAEAITIDDVKVSIAKRSMVSIRGVEAGSKVRLVGASDDRNVYLGKREGRDLVYMGKVGTGWSRTVSSQIRKQLDTVVSPKSKLTKQIKKPKATWVEPKFFADVEYRDITSEGLLRASSFKGPFRNEKP